MESHAEVQRCGLESHLIAPDDQRVWGLDGGQTAGNGVGHAVGVGLDGDAETAWNQPVKLGLDGFDRSVWGNHKNEARTARGEQIEVREISRSPARRRPTRSRAADLQNDARTGSRMMKRPC